MKIETLAEAHAYIKALEKGIQTLSYAKTLTSQHEQHDIISLLSTFSLTKQLYPLSQLESVLEQIHEQINSRWHFREANPTLPYIGGKLNEDYKLIFIDTKKVLVEEGAE